ncbi:competence type IV pilus major pilin ComGC [uncultured Granulicatella sp.]|uniref:competence type IV pilus major pilin ComGC n=1 Tax=uncultured Granulicatella sp. TaxID=316089 RepID=UPI0028D70783|nr:competence type IV pilus major pilin ComGC [uncultured Granulicatella sp.]
MKKLLKKKKGFTLIELLICLFIIGLMMLLIIPNIANQRQKAQEKSDAAIVKVIENQQELYQLDKNVKEKPDVSTLKNDGYITQEQLDSYNKAKGKTQTSPQ